MWDVICDARCKQCTNFALTRIQFDTTMPLQFDTTMYTTLSRLNFYTGHTKTFSRNILSSSEGPSLKTLGLVFRILPYFEHCLHSAQRLLRARFLLAQIAWNKMVLTACSTDSVPLFMLEQCCIGIAEKLFLFWGIRRTINLYVTNMSMLLPLIGFLMAQFS